MPIPDFQSVMLPLFKLLADNQIHTMRELTATLADQYALNDDERNALLPSGQQTILSNRVAWAKSHLKAAGLIDNPSRGKVSLSSTGQQVLAREPAKVDVRFLKQFPAYLQFIARTNSDSDAEPSERTEETATKTPREMLDEAYRTLRKANAEEIRSRLAACSPAFFEKVVVELLLAMGYGGVAGDGSITGKPGDGGIDGIIKEDKLGLDVVCIQAKRWEGSVGRPKIQEFVGSMDYIRAKKGVILTTSSFTRDATEFVERIEGKKVVLIDGAQLAEFMIDHNVGVTVSKTYEVKEVSNDFFDEDEGA